LAEKKENKPRIWVPEVEGQLVCCHHNGFRVGRLTQLKYDPNTKQVIEIRIATYGGDEHVNQGYNGPEATLTDRRHFVSTGQHIVCGMLLGKTDIQHLDDVVTEVVEGTRELRKPEIIHMPKPDKTTRSAPAKQAQQEKPDKTEAAPPKRQPRQAPPDAPGATKKAREVSTEPPKAGKAQRQPRKPVPEAPVDLEAEVEGWDTDADAEVAAEADAQEDQGPGADDLDFEEDPAPQRLVPADDVDPKAIPPLVKIQTTVQDELLTERLAAVLKANPKLMKESSAPGEPRWDVKCPDGATLDIGGYGPEPREKHKPVKATVLHVVGYTPPPKEGRAPGGGFMGSTMPAALVHGSVRQLCKKYETEAPKAPAKPLPKLDLSGDDDDYFKET